jgi:hypothetical protein
MKRRQKIVFSLTPINRGQVILVIAAGAAREQMLLWIAAQSIQSRVRVLDGGNQFNVYKIAKNIRRQTSRVHAALLNIQISRCFSCYQMTSALEKTEAVSTPLFLLDFLFSYYDEDIRLGESLRLVRKSIRDLINLSIHAPIVIGVRPQMYSPDRSVLLKELKEIPTQLWEVESPNTHIPPPALPWPLDVRKDKR